MSKAQYEDNISFGTITHSECQLELLCKRPKYLKDYQVPISFQNLCFGLQSLVTHEYSLPVIRYNASFIIHLDDFQENFIFSPPESLSRMIRLCCRLLSSHSAHEVLLCETIHLLYDSIQEEKSSSFDCFLQYVLLSVQEEIKSYLSELPSYARISPKIKALLKAPSVPDPMVGEMSKFPQCKALFLFLNETLTPNVEQRKKISESIAMCYSRISAQFTALEHRGSLAALFDVYFVLLFHGGIDQLNVLETVTAVTASILSYVEKAQSAVSQHHFSEEWKDNVILRLLRGFSNIFLSGAKRYQTHKLENLPVAVRVFTFVIDDVFRALFEKDNLVALPEGLDNIFLLLQFHEENTDSETFVTWEEGITTLYQSSVHVSLNLDALSKSTIPPRYWAELTNISRCTNNSKLTLDSSQYESKLNPLNIHELIAVMHCFQNEFNLENDHEISALLTELAKVHILTGSSLRSAQFFFSSHLHLPIKELLAVNLSVEEQTTQIREIIHMSCVAIGQGLCRMKIYVIHLPTIIKSIREFCTEGDTVHIQHFIEALSALCNAIIGACDRGANPEYLLSCTRNLLLIASDHERFINIMKLLPDRFEMHGSYDRLLELQFTYDICVGRLELPPESVSRRLYLMISSGQRRDLRKLWQLMKSDFFSEKYRTMRSLLFQFPGFSPAEVSRLLSILLTFYSLTSDTCNPVISKYASYLLQELSNKLEITIGDENASFSADEMSKISEQLNHLILYQNIFPNKMQLVEEKFFPTLAEEKEKDKVVEAEEIPCDENEECEETIVHDGALKPKIHLCVNEEEFFIAMRDELGNHLFPEDVVEDKVIMEALLVAAARIDSIRKNRPKYLHVCDITQEALQYFITCVSGREVQALGLKERMTMRKEALKKWILELPQNQQLIIHLQNFGYQAIWDDDLYIVVEMKLYSDADETFFYNILDNYRKIEYLLFDLGIKTVTDITGHVIPVEKGQVFTADMSLSSLEIRKSAVIKAINNAPNNSCARGCIKDYQVQEDKIRLQYLEKLREQKQLEKSDNQTKKFVIRLHNSFFHSTTICVSEGGLAECYAPKGIHAEKPLENALKVNAKFISVYEYKEIKQKPNEQLVIGDVIGKQLENTEVIYTDQGLYFYRIYSRGHSFNTSEIWASFMKSLLTQNFVPAIILANGYPNSRCFGYLSRHIQPEIYPTMLNFRDDFFSNEGISSYYDFHPEKINIGDLVITEEKIRSLVLPQSTILSSNQEGVFMRNSSSVLTGASALRIQDVIEEKKAHERQKDFCGTIITDTIARAQQSDVMTEHRATLQAWAKFLSQFINKYISTGELQPEILVNGFDLKLYNARIRKANKRKKKKKTQLQAKELTEQDKEVMIREFVTCFAETIVPYYKLTEEELMELFDNQKLNFFELRLHLEYLVRVLKRHGVNAVSLDKSVRLDNLQQSLFIMHRCLKSHSRIESIASFNIPKQEYLVRWAFWNEDKVWRYRGGRLETTVNDFLEFVHPKEYSGYPGSCIVATNDENGELESMADCEKRVIAYLVGEFVSANTYEIVTAWTDPHYTRLNFAVSMYLRTMKELYESYNCQYVVLDIKKGSYESIVKSSAVFTWLCKVGLDRYIVLKQEDSYEQKLQGGQSEQFQRVELYLPIIVKFMKLHSWWNSFKRHHNIHPSIQETPTFRESKPHFVPISKDTPLAQLQKRVINNSVRMSILATAIVLPIYFCGRF